MKDTIYDSVYLSPLHLFSHLPYFPPPPLAFAIGLGYKGFKYQSRAVSIPGRP